MIVVLCLVVLVCGWGLLAAGVMLFAQSQGLSVRERMIRNKW